jgi:hypothetical protein
MFRDKKYVYIDMHHYNPVACAAIAGRIVEVIRKDRLIK